MSSSAVARPVVQARLLLVDDNGLGLQARRAVLEEQGYRVTAVASPQDALNRLIETQFDLIITDHKFQDMSGVDLIRTLRQQGISTPVILLSGFVDTLGLDEKNTGADVVLQKSANEISHLCRAVRQLLRRKAPKKPAKAEGGGVRRARKKA
jgi:CheY-like chemotaxis protein